MSTLKNILIFSGILLIAVLMFLFTSGYKTQDELFNEGKISVQQYCDPYKTSTQIPAGCYAYFAVKPNGQTCRLVGKVTVCDPDYLPSNE